MSFHIIILRSRSTYSICFFTIQFEFNFFPFQSGETKNYPSPYIFAGGSFFSFNPVGTLDGEKYNLQKLGTEGQGLTTNPNKKYYSLMRPSFPFGFGIKFNPINRISVALEWGLRRCFTDYLDDVSTEYPNKYELAAEKGEEASRLSDKSINGIGDKTGLQRGNPNTKDYYSFAGIIIYYKLFKPRCPQFQ